MVLPKMGYVHLWALAICICISHADALRCKENAHCTCNEQLSSRYDINCGRGDAMLLEIKVERDEVSITCKTFPHTEIWSDLLIGLNIGHVDTLIFKSCPTLPSSFHNITQSMNIPNVKNLYFNAYQREPGINFQPHHFKNLSSVTNLYLNENGIRILDPKLFQELGNLTNLRIHGNNISVIMAETFSYTPKLKYLDIGNNNLTDLDPEVFRHTPELTFLNMYSNKLKNNLRREVFKHVKLQSLDLSGNGITSLDEDLFDELPDLKVLNLNLNNITMLPKGIFNKTRALFKLRLNHNFRPLSLPEAAFANLGSLEELTLMNNNITQIPKDVFNGTYKLKMLSLRKNSLRYISSDVFKDTHQLQELDISQNKLTAIDDAAFLLMGNLKKLYLNNNQLEVIPRTLFSNMSKLEFLYLNNNKLTTIIPGAFAEMRYLKEADLSYNALTFEDSSQSYEFSQYSPFSKCSNLEVLKLERNNIKRLFLDWGFLLQNLKTLNLRYNNISLLNNENLQFLHPIEVDVSYNNITTVDLSKLESISKAQCDEPPCTIDKVEDRKVRITLSYNPIICDCRSYHLALYFQEMPEVVHRYMHVESTGVQCSSPVKLENVSLEKVDTNELICNWDTLEVEGNSGCPNKCACYFRPADSAVIVNCSNQNLSQLPTELPTVAFMNHTELILRDNNITSIDRIAELKAYRNVTKYYLASNKIKNINATYFSPYLQVLELDNNELTHLDNNTLQLLKRSQWLKKITLHNNPWRCDCDTQYLLYFLQERFEWVQNLKDITCDETGRIITELLVDDLCSISLSIIIMSVSIAVIGLSLGAALAFYYRYQHEIKVWLFAHKICLWLVAEKEIDRHKKYDAFVSFSHADEDFVIKHLIPELEKGPHPFKLCIHFRDWIAGEWIPNQIIRSVEDSRRTIVVLSPNFLDSVWGKLEFRTAHLKAIKERCARVVVILYADIGDTDKLDSELKAYLSMNTYLKWGDARFWDKLRYALPHPPEYCKQLPLLKNGHKNKKFRSAFARFTKSDLDMNGTVISEQEEKIRELQKIYQQKV